VADVEPLYVADPRHDDPERDATSTSATAPRAVARATTQAVVLSSVLILVCDYFMGSVLP